ncbi:MAG: SDR family oxidoreductase [Phycisphaerae bacterium]|nr:SDR family oxidoreductase [Phycisphaerae bacterium]
MNILVTGAAGFVGSNFCDRLIDEGHTVVGVDNFVTGRARNLDHLAGHARFTLRNADVSEPIGWPDGLPKPAAIVHMASPASPVDFGPLAIRIMRANAEGTYHMLELARAMGARFLLASTSEVYGDPEVHPQTEEYVGHVSTVGPRAVYDESKRYAEAMVCAYRRQYQADARIVRIFNTYGPRMRPDDGRVLPAFISAAFREEPLPVQGDGSQTRSFCYITDLVEGIYRLLMSDQLGPINIGNPDEVTIKQVAEEVIAATGSKSTIRYQPAPPDDPRRRCPDITKAARLLGWAPKVARKEGLARTIAYFRTLLGKTEAPAGKR